MTIGWVQLQEQLAVAYAHLMEVCLACGNGQLLVSDRSLHAVVAHLAGWDREAAARFRLFLAGPTDDIQYDVDAFNAHAVVVSEHLSWDEVIADLRAAHRELQAAIAAVDPAHVAADGRFAQWLLALNKHYDEHTREVHGIQSATDT